MQTRIHRNEAEYQWASKLNTDREHPLQIYRLECLNILDYGRFWTPLPFVHFVPFPWEWSEVVSFCRWSIPIMVDFGVLYGELLDS